MKLKSKIFPLLLLVVLTSCASSLVVQSDFDNEYDLSKYKTYSIISPSLDDKDELKLIKMDPGVSVPLHSHGGKEYILVLEGSFCDEYGEYSKGDIQINDQKIKHTPIASKDTGCVCLSITEKDVIFFGKYGSFLNLFTFIKSFFKQK